MKYKPAEESSDDRFFLYEVSIILGVMRMMIKTVWLIDVGDILISSFGIFSHER